MTKLRGLKVTAEEIAPLRNPFMKKVRAAMRAQKLDKAGLAERLDTVPSVVNYMFRTPDLWLSDMVAIARELNLEVKLVVRSKQCDN